MSDDMWSRMGSYFDVRVNPIRWKGIEKFAVLFNGEEIECFDDTRCPGISVCAINESWSKPSSEGGWCMCPTPYGLNGQSCRELCPSGYMIMIANAITILCGIAVMATSLYLLIVEHGVFKVRRSKLVSPSITSLVLTLGTSIFVLVGCALELVRTIGFRDFSRIENNSSSRRVRRIPPPIEMTASAIWAMAFAFTKCSLLLLPFVWIDLVESSLRCRIARPLLSIGISISLLVVILAIQIPLTLLVSARPEVEAPPWSLSSIIIWGVICFGTIVANSSACIKVQKLRKISFANDQRRNIVRLALNRIKWMALVLSIVDFVTLWTLVLGWFRSSRSNHSNPNCFTDRFDIMFRLSIFMSVFICGLVNAYLWKESGTRQMQRRTTAD